MLFKKNGEVWFLYYMWLLVFLLDILHRVEMMSSPTFLGQKLWTVQDHPFVPSVLLGPAKPENVSTAQYRNSPLATADVPQEIKRSKRILLHDPSWFFSVFFVFHRNIYGYEFFIKAIKHCRKHLRLIPRLIPYYTEGFLPFNTPSFNTPSFNTPFNTLLSVYFRNCWPFDTY